jgi:hypothetical protein
VFAFDLTNNGTSAHPFLSISAIAPLTLDTVSPTLPVRLPANGTVTFALSRAGLMSAGQYFSDGTPTRTDQDGQPTGRTGVGAGRGGPHPLSFVTAPRAEPARPSDVVGIV